jgi:hypothetical protein
MGLVFGSPSAMIEVSGKPPDSSRGGLMRLKISTNALDDHNSRLYGHDDSTDTMQVHIDMVGATYTIIKRTKTVITVEMSEAAIADFLSDMDYQHSNLREWLADDDAERIAYGRACGRAAASVRKQIENQ